MTFWIGFIAGYIACPVSCALLALVVSGLSNLYFALRRQK